MHDLLEENVRCPYCGEFISILIDPSEPEQQYIEDCEVCCRPISIAYVIDESGERTVSVHREDE